MTINELLKAKARRKQIAMQLMLEHEVENDEQFTKKVWYFIKNVFDSVSPLEAMMNDMVAVSAEKNGVVWEFQIIRGSRNSNEDVFESFLLNAEGFNLDWEFIKQKAEEEGLEFIPFEDSDGFGVYAEIHPEHKS